MRAAVISDSHLSRPNAFFEAVYAEHLAPADYVIHCGDHTGQSLWSYLIQHPGHISVAGNCDGFALGGDPPPLAELVLELCNSSSEIVRLPLPDERGGDPQRRCPDLTRHGCGTPTRRASEKVGSNIPLQAEQRKTQKFLKSFIT